MFRVLHVMGCGDAGGISTVVLNYYRFIDRTKIHFDIALTVPTVGQNARALEALGAEIFILPMKSEGLGAFRRELARLLREGRYDAIHVHESETSYVALQVAKKVGVPCRIAHSHTSSRNKGLKWELRRLSGCLLNYHYATRVVGCGQLAGERVFGKRNMKRPKALVLPNAIDTVKFAYNEAVRGEVRRELGLEGRFVIGMVGRLSPEKNPGYAVDLLPLVRQRIENAVLVMAGDGPEEESIRARIHGQNLEDAVLLLGKRDDAQRLYQGFDLFLLSSFTEGFPVVAVEAIASGLPVLLSDTITRELSFGSAVTYLPLEDPAQWVRAMETWLNPGGRIKRQTEAAENGLDIRTAVQILERVYLQAPGAEK